VLRNLLLIASLVAINSHAAPVPVEITGEAGSFSLLRGGHPYTIRGAGTQVVDSLDSLKNNGGNSVRTWSSDVGELLDRAEALGISVSVCLDVKRERHGFDYDDQSAVQKQFETLRGEVLKYRDHPALLTLIIGNELNHSYTNPRVYDAVNDLSKMIHELDPHHPTTTATAGISKSLLEVISTRASDIDFLSVQVYGGIANLDSDTSLLEFGKPIMITEWGTKGHWEVPNTSWDAPLELTSSAKADFLRRGLRVLDSLSGVSIGSYVFLWGYKQERTPTWYGLFTADGGRTESVEVMKAKWQPDQRANGVPRVVSFTLNGQLPRDNIKLQAGRTYSADIDIADPEDDPLTFSWRLMEESRATQTGGDAEETPAEMSWLIEGNGPSVSIKAPREPGAYRLYVYAHDPENGVAHANIPFYVKVASSKGDPNGD